MTLKQFSFYVRAGYHPASPPKSSSSAYPEPVSAWGKKTGALCIAREMTVALEKKVKERISPLFQEFGMICQHLKRPLFMDVCRIPHSKEHSVTIRKPDTPFVIQ
jgi:hypothetical protein